MALFDNIKRFLRTPASGANVGKQAIEDANLVVKDRLVIPVSDDNTFNGGKEEDGVVKLSLNADGDLILNSYADGKWTEYLAVLDGLKSVGEITLLGNDVTVVAPVKWRINSVNYQKLTNTVITVNSATDGFKRIDYIYADTNNNILLIEGTEVADGNPYIPPTLPVNTVMVAPVYISGDTVSQPIPDLSSYLTKVMADGYYAPVEGSTRYVQINPTVTQEGMMRLRGNIETEGDIEALSGITSLGETHTAQLEVNTFGGGNVDTGFKVKNGNFGFGKATIILESGTQKSSIYLGGQNYNDETPNTLYFTFNDQKYFLVNTESITNYKKLTGSSLFPITDPKDYVQAGYVDEKILENINIIEQIDIENTNNITINWATDIVPSGTKTYQQKFGNTIPNFLGWYEDAGSMLRYTPTVSVSEVDSVIDTVELSDLYIGFIYASSIGISSEETNNFVLKKSLYSSWLKNKDTNYTQKEIQAINAISNLEVYVPSSDINDEWLVQLLTRIPTSGDLPLYHNYSLQIQNVTKNEYYNVVNLGALFSLNQTNKVYSSRGYFEKSTGQAKFIEFSVTIDWASLPSDFEIISSTLFINVGVNTNSNTSLVKYPNSNLRDKTYLLFGTSIPEAGMYHEYATRQHGAVIINNALGSSPVRFGKKDGSYNGLNWESYTLSLSATLSEKEDIIANWETVRLGLTESPPVTLTTEQADKIRNSSFEIRLMPYLNGTYAMPNVFVFDHLFNDRYYELGFETEEEYYSVPATYNDRRTPIGALNFLIDKIYEANPRAKIIIVGHYENQANPPVSIAQQNAANYRALPLVKMWEVSGITLVKVPNTQQYWDNAPWSYYSSNLYPGESTSDNMTMRRFLIPDGIHPHTDETGLIQIALGDHLGANLNKIF